MKKYKLDKEEKEILRAFNKGELKTIPNFEKRKRSIFAVNSPFRQKQEKIIKKG